MATQLCVQIDREDCISCAQCWTTCPAVFEQNPDDDHSQVIAAYRTGDALGEGVVPPALAACAREAADGCPVQVIHVADVGAA